DQCEVRGDSPLEHVRSAVEVPDVLAVGDLRPVPGRRVDGGQARAAGPHPLDERALRHHLQRQFPGRDLLLRLGHHAGPGREARHQVRDLVVVGEQVPGGEPRLAEAVAVHGQPARPLLAERRNERRRIPVRQAEPGDADARAVFDVRDRFGSGHYFAGRRGHARASLQNVLTYVCLTIQSVITAATSALFFSSIIAWPLPCTPRSPRRISSTAAPHDRRYSAVLWQDGSNPEHSADTTATGTPPSFASPAPGPKASGTEIGR